jgi:hypothetical protein
MTVRPDAAAAATARPGAAAVTLPDRGVRAIELTVLMTSGAGGVIQLFNHEQESQRVAVRLPGRRLQRVHALGDGGYIPHASDADGSTITITLPVRELLILRFTDTPMAAPAGVHQGTRGTL